MFLGDAPALFYAEILVRTVIIYGYTLLLIRWIGGRSVAQLSMVDTLLVIALGSAAIRKDPDALGEVIYGIGRAGIGTSVVVALTIIALTAADGISNEFAKQMPAAFYKTLATQWGGSGWGGFGAAALAFFGAAVSVFVEGREG